MSGKVEEISLVKERFNSGMHKTWKAHRNSSNGKLSTCTGQDPKLNDIQDINAITGALKSFLRSLPTPLIHGECYTDLMEEVRSSKNNK